MMLEPELAAMLTSQVTVAAPAARDVYGHTTWAAGVTYAARVSPIAGQVTALADNRTVPVVAHVYMDGDVPIDPNYRLTLPDGSTPVIVAVDRPCDLDGSVYYTKVVCG